MLLGLEEAATRLKRSVRQLRYQIDNGRVVAKKISGRWFVDVDAAPPAPDAANAQRQIARARKAEHLKEIVHEALDLTPKTLRARYSVTDLRAFQIALPLYRSARASLGPDHPGVGALHKVLECLAIGCHRFDKPDKARAYSEARDQASRAVCALLIDNRGTAAAPATDDRAAAVLTTDGAADTTTFVSGIEQELMPALAGLLRRAQPRLPRGLDA